MANKRLAMLAATAFLAGTGTGHAANGIEARIDIRQGEAIELVGIVQRAGATGVQPVTWRFEIRRTSPGGRSQSVQSGRAELAAGDEVVVGRAALGGAGHGTIEAALVVHDGEAVVASTSVRLPQAAHSNGDGK